MIAREGADDLQSLGETAHRFAPGRGSLSGAT